MNQQYQEQIEERKKHSVLGIISVLIGVIMIAAFFSLMVLTQVSESYKPGSMDEDSPVAMFTGLAMLGIAIINLVGAVFGLIGIFQKKSKKLFPVTGAFLNLLFLFGLIGIFILAMVFG
jgi:hypothetical protein